jgi:hypothetical protein
MNYKRISLIIFAIFLIGASVYRDSRIDERKNIKYYVIDPSAEPYRTDIESAYDEWTKETGIVFIEGYKPYRTVTIYAQTSLDSPEPEIIGLYYWLEKNLYVYTQGDRFYPVFLHEAGHSIGLLHNNDLFDIMYPYNMSFQNISSTCLHDLKKAKNQSKYLLFY